MQFRIDIPNFHGQTWNASEIARSMGLSDKTVRSYLDILTGTFMMRQLQPWYENIGKRQVKAPKIYLRDSGLLHHLLSLPDLHSLSGHPRVGASWEGFALEQVIQAVKPPEIFFWATHNGSEIDLFFMRQGAVMLSNSNSARRRRSPNPCESPWKTLTLITYGSFIPASMNILRMKR